MLDGFEGLSTTLPIADQCRLPLHWQPEKASAVLTVVSVPGVTVIEPIVGGFGLDVEQLGARPFKLYTTGGATGVA